MTITLRTVKGAALTHAELDGNFTDLDDRVTALALTTVTITDAAVSMVANRRYVGSIAAFTADRNYTVPAGTPGDAIEIQLLAGDDLYELIIIGDTGVQINGGTAATEFTRLFITSEFLRLRCVATNDWRVEIDGRIPCVGKPRQTVAQNITHFTSTTVTMDSADIDVGNCCNLGSDSFVARRAGKYIITGYTSLTSLDDATRVYVLLSVGGTPLAVTSSFVARNSSTIYPNVSDIASLVVGDAVTMQVQWDISGGSGTKSTLVSSAVVQSRFSVVEQL